jgi:DME family drug/metabolite transporter
MADVAPRDLWRGRLLVITAATLWSLNGFFGKLLTKPDAWLGLGDPPVDGVHIAFYRCFFAGLLLAPAVPRSRLRWQPMLLGMMICFATMNAMFVFALTLGTAASALILQYTAPLWLVLAAWRGGTKPGRLETLSLCVAMVGIGIIIQDGVAEALIAGGTRLWVVLLGLGSGVTFAGVLLCLKYLQDQDAIWLTVLNQGAAALLVLPFLWLRPQPTGTQLAVLAVFGVVQLGLPYVLMTRGLRYVAAKEAGLLGLIEPLLNPLWAYAVAREVPETSTLVGGALILLALMVRYLPWQRRGAAGE